MSVRHATSQVLRTYRAPLTYVPAVTRLVMTSFNPISGLAVTDTRRVYVAAHNRRTVRTTPLTICRSRTAHVTVDLYAFYARWWLSEASAAASTPGDLFFGGRNFACNEPRATPA